MFCHPETLARGVGVSVSSSTSWLALKLRLPQHPRPPTGPHPPAEVGGEHVERLVLGDHGVEGGSVGAVDHVALLRRPPGQLPAGGSRKQHTHSLWASVADLIQLVW